MHTKSIEQVEMRVGSKQNTKIWDCHEVADQIFVLLGGLRHGPLENVENQASQIG